jgi:hypothetical protein
LQILYRQNAGKNFPLFLLNLLTTQKTELRSNGRAIYSRFFILLNIKELSCSKTIICQGKNCRFFRQSGQIPFTSQRKNLPEQKMGDH